MGGGGGEVRGSSALTVGVEERRSSRSRRAIRRVSSGATRAQKRIAVGQRAGRRPQANGLEWLKNSCNAAGCQSGRSGARFLDAERSSVGRTET